MEKFEKVNHKTLSFSFAFGRNKLAKNNSHGPVICVMYLQTIASGEGSRIVAREKRLITTRNFVSPDEITDASSKKEKRN